MQPQPKGLALGLQRRQGLGVGHRNRKSRDARHANVVVHGAGVGHPFSVGADAAYTQGQRAAFGRFRSAVDPRRHCRAVTAAVAGTFHFLVDKNNAAAGALAGVGTQGCEVGVPGDVGLDAGCGRGHAVAQGGHHQVLRHRAQQLRSGRATHPGAHRKTLGTHVGQLQPAQGRLRPCGGFGVSHRTRRPGTHVVAQRLQQLPGGAVGQRSVAQACGLGQVGGGVAFAACAH